MLLATSQDAMQLQKRGFVKNLIAVGFHLTGCGPLTTAPRVVLQTRDCFARTGTPTYAPRVGRPRAMHRKPEVGP